MRSTWRVLATGTLALGGAVTASAASAQVDGCTPAGPGYIPTDVCQLAVTAEVVCQGGDPALSYQADPQGTDAAVVSVRWLNPHGSDVVVPEQPLAGSLSWPDGDWAADRVEVVFASDAATVTQAFTACSVSDEGPSDDGEDGASDDDDATGTAGSDRGASSDTASAAALSDTGFPVAGTLGIAGGLVAAGAVAVAATRGRRQGAHRA